jgi:hypothetical protein
MSMKNTEIKISNRHLELFEFKQTPTGRWTATICEPHIYVYSNRGTKEDAVQGCLAQISKMEGGAEQAVEALDAALYGKMQDRAREAAKVFWLQKMAEVEKRFGNEVGGWSRRARNAEDWALGLSKELDKLRLHCKHLEDSHEMHFGFRPYTVFAEPIATSKKSG